MTRIIAGTSRGRRLATPAGAGTRPTSERVREALFSRLEHLDAIDGVAVLDLYAGSGALGLEALSRGADRVVLVESARKAAGIARRNAAEVGADARRARREEQDASPAAALGEQGGPAPKGELAVVVGEPVERYLRGTPGRHFGLVFVDPPYELEERALAEVLDRLTGWLEPDALVVVERSSRAPEPTWPPYVPGAVEAEGARGGARVAGGLELADERRYGETRLWFARPIGPAAAGTAPREVSTTVSVRRIGPDDWATLRELRLAALRTDPDAFGSTPAREEAFGRPEWEARCANPDSYVAFLGNRPVGLGALMPLTATPSRRTQAHALESTSPGPGAAATSDAPGVVRDVVGLWTDPSARGHGVAAAVTAALVDAARAQGAPGLRLMVVQDNGAAMRLYRRVGFRESGVSEPMPGRPHLRQVEMTMDLE